MGDMSISVPCPKCRKSTIKMLSDLEMSSSVVCPSCGGITDLTKQEWRAALLKAREAADEFDPKPN
jgi:hypothetical protein